MRTARNNDLAGVCPLCVALATTDVDYPVTGDPTDRNHPRFMRVDDGCTEPLCGILCDECAAAMRGEGTP